MSLLANNLLTLNQRLYSKAIPRYYKLFGYEVIIITSDKTLDYDNNYENDKFKKGYGSQHSSTYTQTSKTIEKKVNIIIPNIKEMTNLYNDSDSRISIYHTDKNLMIIGDILKINYNNKLYEFKSNEHPTNYYDILYEFKLSSMYIGIIN